MAAAPRVAVLGGGIIGISSAVCAIEAVPDLDVTVIAERFTPDTTGDGAAGFWNPYLLGDVSPDTMKFWCHETFDFLQRIWLSPEASTCGVGLLSAYFLYKTEEEKVVTSDAFLSLRDMTTKEMELFPKQFKYGTALTTLYAECKKLLPVLMERFRSKGGKIVQRRVQNLSELVDEYDVVINCPGVEASQFVPDPQVAPIRGQVIRVKAPWIKHAVVSPEFHILPNSELIVCGGTHQNSWSTEVDPEDRRRIWEGCTALVPSLKKAEIVQDWVGLRPGRSSPRLERETLPASGGRLHVIHNYGHGGSGITLFWGCAKQVVEMLKEALNESSEKPIMSKI